MKTIFIFILSLFTLFITAAYIRMDSVRPLNDRARQDLIDYKNKNILNCSPDFSKFDFSDSTEKISLLEGWGTYHMPVTATNDSSEIYFQQGINMYYGFHVIEALASFEKSITFDSSFAMGYWGKALAYGPNINDFGYSASPDALAAVQKASTLSGSSTGLEKGLIAAMQLRYSPDTTQSREHLNGLYAGSMKKLYTSFPQSADVAALYTDALMVQHPWDLYDVKTYTPRAWTPEIVNVLEKLLKQFPDHPGASHYYIHAIEASEYPEKGLTAAKKLPIMMPGVAHVVHMPSHIYIRSGYYSQGEAVNDQAVKAYYSYLGKFPAVVNNTPLYLIHNLHMQATCANMEGRFSVALRTSIDCRNSFDSSMQAIPGFFGVYVQYLYMTPLLTMIRFGKWDDILKTPESPESLVYANLLWHYGRGMAFARKHDFENMKREIAAVKKGLANSQLKAPAPSYANPAINGAQVADKILEGVAAEEQKDLVTAANSFQEAVNLEDAMIYNEPRDWVHPARQYLGNVLLKAARYPQAERVFREDLKINPNNGWSLTGLASALKKQRKMKEADTVQEKAATAFSKTEKQIYSAVF